MRHHGVPDLGSWLAGFAPPPDQQPHDTAVGRAEPDAAGSQTRDLEQRQVRAPAAVQQPGGQPATAVAHTHRCAVGRLEQVRHGDHASGSGGEARCDLAAPLRRAERDQDRACRWASGPGAVRAERGCRAGARKSRDDGECGQAPPFHGQPAPHGAGPEVLRTTSDGFVRRTARSERPSRRSIRSSSATRPISSRGWSMVVSDMWCRAARKVLS